jgi:putative transposase
MDEAEPDVLAFMTSRPPQRAKLHANRHHKSLNDQITPRTDVVGIFPNEGAITRLVGASCSNKNKRVVRRAHYMPPKTISTMSDDPTIRLFALPV